MKTKALASFGSFVAMFITGPTYGRSERCCANVIGTIDGPSFTIAGVTKLSGGHRWTTTAV